MKVDLMSDLPSDWLDNLENTSIEELDRLFGEMEEQKQQAIMQNGMAGPQISDAKTTATTATTSQMTGSSTRKKQGQFSCQ